MDSPRFVKARSILGFTASELDATSFDQIQYKHPGVSYAQLQQLFQKYEVMK